VQYEGNTVKYTDLCEPDGAGTGCYHMGVVDFWGRNKAVYDASPTKLADTYAATFYQSPIQAFSESWSYGLVDHADGSRSVRSLNMFTQLKAKYGYDDKRDAVKKWEGAWLEKVAKLSEDVKRDGFDLVYLAGRSFDDEIGKTITQDLPLVGLAYVAMFFFTLFMTARSPTSFLNAIKDGVDQEEGVFYELLKKFGFSKWKLYRIGSRGCLVGQGLGVVFMSMMSGYGVGMYLGFHFVSLSSLLPFLLV